MQLCSRIKIIIGEVKAVRKAKIGGLTTPAQRNSFAKKIIKASKKFSQKGK